ncbi:MAG TPA: nucleoside 2-deoxyribosyltransferase [Myxococcales bacterium]
MSKLIYVAGPLFNEAERLHDERIAEECENLGFRTFLPHRDAGLETNRNSDEIYAADLHNLEQADFLVANLDGADVDAGTAWEIGYAVARGKTVIGLRTDRRCLEPWARVNLMIEKSSYIVTSFGELRSALATLGGNVGQRARVAGSG